MTVQHNFCHAYGTEAPTDKSVIQWFTQFKETGSAENMIKNVLRKFLRLHAYKIQLTHEFEVTDYPKYVE
jgi:hypothetical protein